jgi:hypothetical protein
VLKHPSLKLGQTLRVRLAGELLFDSTVTAEGRIRLNERDLVAEPKAPAAGMTVSVEIGGAEIFSEALYDD